MGGHGGRQVRRHALRSSSEVLFMARLRPGCQSTGQRPLPVPAGTSVALAPRGSGCSSSSSKGSATPPTPGRPASPDPNPPRFGRPPGPRAVREPTPTPPPCYIRDLLARKRVIDMPGARQLKPMDMVAVLNGSGEPEIQAGDVGAIVELLPPDGLEVEFPGRDGRTRHIARSPPATCSFSIASGRASPDDAGAHSRAAPSGDFVLRDGRGSARSTRERSGRMAMSTTIVSHPIPWCVPPSSSWSQPDCWGREGQGS